MKGLRWQSLREFGVMAHVEKYLRSLFLNWEYHLSKQKQFFNIRGFFFLDESGEKSIFQFLPWSIW